MQLGFGTHIQPERHSGTHSSVLTPLQHSSYSCFIENRKKKLEAALLYMRDEFDSGSISQMRSPVSQGQLITKLNPRLCEGSDSHKNPNAKTSLKFNISIGSSCHFIGNNTNCDTNKNSRADGFVQCSDVQEVSAAERHRTVRDNTSSHRGRQIFQTLKQ